MIPKTALFDLFNDITRPHADDFDTVQHKLTTLHYTVDGLHAEYLCGYDNEIYEIDIKHKKTLTK